MASGEDSNAQAVISIGFVLARFDPRKDFSLLFLRECNAALLLGAVRNNKPLKNMITTMSVSTRMLAAAHRDTGMQLTPLAYIAYHGLGYTVKHRNQHRNFTMAELEAIGTFMHEHDTIVADMESERIDGETATEKLAALRARNLTAFMAE